MNTTRTAAAARNTAAQTADIAQNAQGTPANQNPQATAPRKGTSDFSGQQRRPRIVAGLASVLVSTVLFASLVGGFHVVSSESGTLARATDAAHSLQRA